MEFYTSKKLVCLIPQKLGLGGPASFQARLTSGLTRMGIEVTHDPLDPAVSAILVNGGTKDLALLYQAKRRGVRIVQRLNGMNWIHRKRFTGIRHFVRAEWGNWVLGQIRNHLADAIVYQSQFSQRWWNDARGEIAAAGTVIYNGVDLSAFTPRGLNRRLRTVTLYLSLRGIWVAAMIRDLSLLFGWWSCSITEWTRW